MGKLKKTTEIGISRALQWMPVPDTLPPDPEGGWFSPIVWLALSDGRVIPGQSLHRVAVAKYAEPIHTWFVNEGGESYQLGDDVVVIAWMPFAVPDHPAPERQRDNKPVKLRKA